MSPVQSTLSKTHLLVYVEKERIFFIGQILEPSLQLSFQSNQRLLAHWRTLLVKPHDVNLKKNADDYHASKGKNT
jgi:hypothetical protein